MDPRSAYRTSMAGLRPVAMPNGAEDAAKIIPRSELEKLSSGVLQPGAVPPSLSPAVSAPANGSFDGFLGNMVSEVSAKQAAAGDAMKRSEEHTFELQSRVDISYAVFCLK